MFKAFDWQCLIQPFWSFDSVHKSKNKKKLKTESKNQDIGKCDLFTEIHCHVRSTSIFMQDNKKKPTYYTFKAHLGWISPILVRPASLSTAVLLSVLRHGGHGRVQLHWQQHLWHPAWAGLPLGFAHPAGGLRLISMESIHIRCSLTHLIYLCTVLYHSSVWNLYIYAAP